MLSTTRWSQSGTGFRPDGDEARHLGVTTTMTGAPARAVNSSATELSLTPVGREKTATFGLPTSMVQYLGRFDCVGLNRVSREASRSSRIHRVRSRRKSGALKRLERILGAPEHASEPGQDLLLLQPLAPGRILGSADVLDHREIAQT
jgi:hypothetical protein